MKIIMGNSPKKVKNIHKIFLIFKSVSLSVVDAMKLFVSSVALMLSKQECFFPQMFSLV
jgi:hypothetical protein